MHQLPDIPLLHDLFVYKDGELFKRMKSGKIKRAGTVGYSGSGVPRRTIQINGVRYLEHRVIAHYHGLDCSNQIDHINGNPLDNRIENLMSVTNSENLRNARRKSGLFGGVSFDKSRNKFMAFAAEATGFKNLGRFNCYIDAIACRMAYNRANGYSLRHGR